MQRSRIPAPLPSQSCDQAADPQGGEENSWMRPPSFADAKRRKDPQRCVSTLTSMRDQGGAETQVGRRPCAGLTRVAHKSRRPRYDGPMAARHGAHGRPDERPEDVGRRDRHHVVSTRSSSRSRRTTVRIRGYGPASRGTRPMSWLLCDTLRGKLDGARRGEAPQAGSRETVR